MTIKAAIVKYLNEHVDIVALLGANKCFPNVAPTSANNCIVIRRIDDQPVHDVLGPVGLSEAQIQVDCYSNDSDLRDSLGTKVRQILDGYRGVLSGVYIKSCSLIRSGDEDVNPTDDSQMGELKDSFDFQVWYDF